MQLTNQFKSRINQNYKLAVIYKLKRHKKKKKIKYIYKIHLILIQRMKYISNLQIYMVQKHNGDIRKQIS